MSRTEKQTPAETIAAPRASEFIADTAEKTTALTVLSSQHNTEVTLLASQLGYDGEVSVDALEYEIGNYQRRAVDSCLAVGALLLLLKKQVGHGDFESRIAAHGFSYDTANRFMNAAQKTGNSRNLRLLSGVVKSFSAFSELLFQDDDVLKAIAEMDDVDRMPASELRKTIRSLQGDNTANERLLANQAKKIRKLEREAEKYTPDDIEQQLRKTVSDCELQATAALDGGLRESIKALIAHGEANDKTYTELLAGHLLQVEASCQALREQFGINRALDDVPAWMTNTSGTAA